VRQDIETLEGRIAGYDSRVALSQVSLEMTSRERVHVGADMGLGERLRRSFADSWHALALAARGGAVVVALVGPWLPLLAMLAYLGHRARRRWRLLR
jgi:hypothetical protein